MFTTIMIKNQTRAALKQAFPKLSADLAVQALLSAARLPVAVGPPAVPRGKRPSLYAALWTLAIGQRARLPWRGQRGPDGSFPNQSALYMAVLRHERKSGMVFTRADDGRGL